MAQSKAMRTRAKKLQGRPVCVTLHSGETYVGYITDVNSSELVLASAGTLPPASSGKPSSRSPGTGARAAGTRSGVRGSGVRKPSGRSHSYSRRLSGQARSRSRRPSGYSRSRSRKPVAKVSAFLPMLGSLFGGFGGLGGGAAAGGGGLGGLLGGGMRLFGMVQRFVPVVKMGYGMIKSIRPFLGAVQGLMNPPGEAKPDNE